MEISDEQVEFIRSDLQQRGVSMTSLRDGLLDHLCCMLETDHSGKDFGEAYRNVIREFGEFDFLPLQEETTELIQILQKNTMNKTLRITGFLSCAFIIAGSTFKFMHWPGANILLLLGTFVLAALFLHENIFIFPALVLFLFFNRLHFCLFQCAECFRVERTRVRPAEITMGNSVERDIGR